VAEDAAPARGRRFSTLAIETILSLTPTTRWRQRLTWRGVARRHFSRLSVARVIAAELRPEGEQ
jgi:hypothetical protein